MLAWPRVFCTSLRSRALRSSLVAKSCRRSWFRNGLLPPSSPAFARLRRHCVLKPDSVIGCACQPPGHRWPSDNEPVDATLSVPRVASNASNDRDGLKAYKASESVSSIRAISLPYPIPDYRPRRDQATIRSDYGCNLRHDHPMANYAEAGEFNRISQHSFLKAKPAWKAATSSPTPPWARLWPSS
jgi:hypothetical protein